jgi:mono/diheme cytochrome c family protein
MSVFRGGLLGMAVVAGLLLSIPSKASDAEQPDPAILAQGEYLTRAAGCALCHTDREHHGAAFAGGRALHTPFGSFYAPNITPDQNTGIGNWSEQDFQRALHQGIRADGSNLYPVFPYTSYTLLRDEDVRAIWTYLRSISPVQHVNKSHQLKWYAPPRFMVWFWNKLYFSAGRYQQNPQRSASWNRGAYLANAAAHCAECHTPRNLLGAEKSALRYAGAENKLEDFVAPNITPALHTGIGDWSADALVEYLQTGLDPDGDTAGSVMAECIDNGLRYLRKSDLQAIAEYITTLPSIEHSLRKQSKSVKQQKEEWE